MSEEQQQSENHHEESDNTFLREQLLCELGNQLKAARKSKKLEISEVAQALKLRQVYLHALENGDWQEMPDEVYAIGFLKQYAAFLGVDVTEDVAKLKSAEYQLTKPLTFPDPAIAPRKSWVIVAALAFIVLIILFNMLGEDGNDESTLILPPPVEERVESIIQDMPTSSPAPAETSEPGITPPPELSTHTYDLTAIGSDCWIQLSVPSEKGDDTPELLREFLLKAGETVSIDHAAPYLLLTSGNAGALQVMIDGQMVVEQGALGRDSQVIRNRKLQPTPNDDN